MVHSESAKIIMSSPQLTLELSYDFYPFTAPPVYGPCLCISPHPQEPFTLHIPPGKGRATQSLNKKATALATFVVFFCLLGKISKHVAFLSSVPISARQVGLSVGDVRRVLESAKLEHLSAQVWNLLVVMHK